MSNNKQSSVEWLLDRIEDVDSAKIWDDIKQQAKEMHKEEVLSFESLLDEHEINALNNNTMLLTREEFYNETFGGNNE